MQEEIERMQKIIKFRVGIKEKAVFYARSAKINRGESREDITYEEKNVHLNIVPSQQQTRFLIKELYGNSAGTLRELYGNSAGTLRELYGNDKRNAEKNKSPFMLEITFLWRKFLNNYIFMTKVSEIITFL